jgi:citrate synthase
MTDQALTVTKKGLEGVVVAQTRLSRINGEEGELFYRGINIHDLAENASFEEVAYMLWFGHLPTRSELDEFKARLAEHRAMPEPLKRMLPNFPKQATPMEVLRTATSALSMFDPLANETDSKEGNLDKAIRLTAAFPTVLAAFDRAREGLEPIEPDPELGHAANFLYMLHGIKPDDDSVRAMDTYLILLAEHGLNASTFSARVTASTLGDLYSGVVAALGTLKGPLHGGANQAVMEMLEEIGDVEKARDYVNRALENKERIMGIGHRVYKTEDPRVRHLRRLSAVLSIEVCEPKWHIISLRVEEVALPVLSQKRLYTNVDFYSATVLHCLGIPTDMFTPMFAMSRTVGWTAHVMEQYADNRLIRPRAEYVGPDRVAWVPLEEREPQKAEAAAG